MAENIPQQRMPRGFNMYDMEEAGIVEFEVDSTGKLWVNVDGVCRLRIGHIETISVKLQDPGKTGFGLGDGSIFREY